MDFEIPEFTLPKVLLAWLGATVLWARWSDRGRLKVWGFSKLLRDLGVKGRPLVVLEYGCFVATGVVVGIVFTDPQTGRQAIVAGLGWTGLIASGAEKGEE